MSVTINADDPRTIRAIEIAAEADRWLQGHNAEGEEIYGVPSQSERGRYYIVTLDSCDCPAFLRAHAASGEEDASEPRPCKHILAVRLHTELVRAQRQHSRGRHLTVLPRT